MPAIRCQRRQQLARGTIRHLVSVAHHLARIENVHVDVYIDLVGEPIEYLED
jgi:hypothetical protein